MAKMHRVELFILDPNDDFNTVRDIINYWYNCKYSPYIVINKSESKEFEWDDDLIINKISCTQEEMEQFFEQLED